MATSPFDDENLKKKLSEMQQAAAQWKLEETIKAQQARVPPPQELVGYGIMGAQTITAPAEWVYPDIDSGSITSSSHVHEKEKTPADEAFDIHRSISRNEKERRLLMWVNAKLLSHMEKSGQFKLILGDDKAKWVAYLAQLEVFYPRSTVYKMVRIYRKLSEELTIPEDKYDDVPINRLFDIINFVDTTNFYDWTAKARTLTTRDWKTEIRLIKGLPTIEDEEHEFESKEVEVCGICGKNEAEHFEIEKEAGQTL